MIVIWFCEYTKYQVSLCVKRLVYTNEQGEIVKGVCSNFLCELLNSHFEMTQTYISKVIIVVYLFCDIR